TTIVVSRSSPVSPPALALKSTHTNGGIPCYLALLPQSRLVAPVCGADPQPYLANSHKPTHPSSFRHHAGDIVSSSRDTILIVGAPISWTDSGQEASWRRARTDRCGAKLGL